MRKDFFIFGGVNSLDYGVLLDGSGTTTAPERDVMTVTIPGRSGDLLVDAGRWKNTTVSYHCRLLPILWQHLLVLVVSLKVTDG